MDFPVGITLMVIWSAGSSNQAFRVGFNLLKGLFQEMDTFPKAFQIDFLYVRLWFPKSFLLLYLIVTFFAFVSKIFLLTLFKGP